MALLLVLGIWGCMRLMDAGRTGLSATPIPASGVVATDQPEPTSTPMPVLESAMRITTSEGEVITVPGVAYLNGVQPDPDVKGVMMVIPIWDAVPHAETVCKLDHGTEVGVLAAQWEESEGRYYLQVESGDCEGWVRDMFVSSEYHEVTGG